jgi:hypothetical protein
MWKQALQTMLHTSISIDTQSKAMDCFAWYSMSFLSRVTCRALAYIGDAVAVFSRILSSSLSPPTPSKIQTPNQNSPILHDGLL